MFLSTYTPEMARGLVEDVARAGAAISRDPGSIRFLVIVTVIVAPTDAEAQAKYDEDLSYASLEGSLAATEP